MTTLNIRIKVCSFKGQEVWFLIDKIKSFTQLFLKEPINNCCKSFAVIWGTNSAHFTQVNTVRKGTKRAQFTTQMCSWGFPDILYLYLWN